MSAHTETDDFDDHSYIHVTENFKRIFRRFKRKSKSVKIMSENIGDKKNGSGCIQFNCTQHLTLTK